MITGKNYIGNQMSSEGKRTFRTFNPIVNKENEVVFTEASTEEINKAVNLASEAFEEFRNYSGLRKSEFLNAIADEIEALGESLIQTYCSESGLPSGRALGERGRTVFQLRSFAHLLKEGNWVEASIDTAQPDRTPIPKPDIRKMLVPIGPVVVFGASNFPLAYSTAGGDTAAALAAGCPVLVKSHPMHAGTGELIASAIIRAAEKTGMPNGVFSNLNSSGIDVGVQLVQHSGVKGVGFTGSIRGGRALYDLAAKRAEPIPVFAEMGSVNPVVFLPDALKERGEILAKTYASSVTLGSGQFCTNPGLLLGIKGEYLDNFITNLSEAIVQIEPGCMLHPNIIGAYESNKKQVMAQAGLALVSEYIEDVPVNFARQAVTTVEGATFLENTALHQEVFGPFTMVVQCANKKQLEAIIKKLEGQLTGTLIGENKELSSYEDVIEALKNRVGRIIFNGVPTGVEVCPSMVHGGPYPASTDSRFTAVGTNSIKRWVRPFSYQDWPDQLLPEALKNDNPLGIIRLVNNVLSKDRT
jgi:alpha-ketoglutaric semialdehyde dehydrogenase